MSFAKIGYGAGDRDPKDTPNVLRMLVGDRTPAVGPRPSDVGSRTSDLGYRYLHPSR